MKTEVNTAKAALQKATTTLHSVRLQYKEQLEELEDDKVALRVRFEDEQFVAAGLRQNLKRVEPTQHQVDDPQLRIQMNDLLQYEIVRVKHHGGQQSIIQRSYLICQ